MNRFFYFKLTFLSMSAGLFTASLVYGLFDIDFSNTEAITKLVLKSFVTATVTGLILGIMNMFLKIGNFRNEKILEIYYKPNFIFLCISR